MDWIECDAQSVSLLRNYNQKKGHTLKALQVQCPDDRAPWSSRESVYIENRSKGMLHKLLLRRKCWTKNPDSWIHSNKDHCRVCLWFSRKKKHSFSEASAKPEVIFEFTRMHYSWPGCCRRPARVPWPIYRATPESISSGAPRLIHEQLHGHMKPFINIMTFKQKQQQMSFFQSLAVANALIMSSPRWWGNIHGSHRMNLNLLRWSPDFSQLVKFKVCAKLVTWTWDN